MLAYCCILNRKMHILQDETFERDTFIFMYDFINSLLSEISIEWHPRRQIRLYPIITYFTVDVSRELNLLYLRYRQEIMDLLHEKKSELLSTEEETFVIFLNAMGRMLFEDGFHWNKFLMLLVFCTDLILYFVLTDRMNHIGFLAEYLTDLIFIKYRRAFLRAGGWVGFVKFCGSRPTRRGNGF